MSQLSLRVISQEEEILSKKVDAVTIPAQEGTMTVLPGHIALFALTKPGELIYRLKTEKFSLLITNGFTHVTPQDEVILIVDEAVVAREISLTKAQEAIKAAQETMLLSRDEKELMMAEASLKRAMLEAQIAKKSKKRQI